MKSGDEKSVESWHVVKSKGKNNKPKKSDAICMETEERTTVGCWNRWKVIGSCISSRSKVDNSISGICTTPDEIKSTNDISKDQPVVPTVSSTTRSVSESVSSTQKLEEKLKITSRLRKFAFNDLKMATRNFRPESLLGEGGFSCVFKG